MDIAESLLFILISGSILLLIYVIVNSIKYGKEFKSQINKLGFKEHKIKFLQRAEKGFIKGSRTNLFYTRQDTFGVWRINKEIIHYGKYSEVLTVFLFKPQSHTEIKPFQIKKKNFFVRLYNNLQGKQFQSPFDHRYKTNISDKNILTDDFKHILYKYLKNHNLEYKNGKFALYKRNKLLKAHLLENTFIDFKEIIEFLLRHLNK